MFNKYFRSLHSLEQFDLRPEVDQRIKSSGTLMLVPFVDHLIFGDVDPIIPIVARGAGYTNAQPPKARGGSSRSDGYGEPDRFEIRFDAPADVQDTYTKTVNRQCQCNKCGTKRDVHVVVSIDPNTSGVIGTASTRKPSGSSTSDQRRAQEYAPGYNMPGAKSNAPRQPPRPQPAEVPRPPTPDAKKQCPRCTFLNHAELTVCEMCQADLPDATIQKPPSPAAVRVPSHSHSASNPPPSRPVNKTLEVERPAGPNRHSLSASLFSIFPFSQQQQQEHHAKLPPTQQTDTTSVSREQRRHEIEREQGRQSAARKGPATEPQPPRKPSTPPSQPESQPERQQRSQTQDEHSEKPELARRPEMSMMPLSPPPTSNSPKRPAPAGLPSNLMDDFVPVSPAFVPAEEGGWGEMRREESRGDDDEDEEEYEGRSSGGLVDLDAVAREEADVWGERED
jgi:hypothetical protein